MIGIYKITNKLNGKVYIGQSINMEKRWGQHITAKDDFAIHNAIKKYGEENFKFEVLLECPAEMLNDWERDMIALYDCMSPYGYNLTEGGGGCKCSEETKIKISNALRGIPLSEETKIKISNANKGKHLSEEHKRKIGNALRGNSRSEETKHKISEARKGMHLSEETKHKISEARKGMHLSEAMKGRRLSEETKIRMSESQKGRHWKIENGKRIWY